MFNEYYSITMRNKRVGIESFRFNLVNLHRQGISNHDIDYEQQASTFLFKLPASCLCWTMIINRRHCLKFSALWVIWPWSGYKNLWYSAVRPLVKTTKAQPTDSRFLSIIQIINWFEKNWKYVFPQNPLSQYIPCSKFLQTVFNYKIQNRYLQIIAKHDNILTHWQIDICE